MNHKRLHCGERTRRLFTGKRQASIRWPVSRVLSVRFRERDGHSSGMCVATHLTRPTRTAIRKRIRCHPYLVLLPVGLAVPSLLPKTRCALTAPFHPHPSEDGQTVLCGAIPGVASAGRYPAPCFRGARTFLPPSRYALRRGELPLRACHVEARRAKTGGHPAI